MTTYKLHMACEDGGSETITIEADTPEQARERAESATEAWIEDGEWGDDGARVSGSWSLTDGDGDEVDEGSVEVEIRPNHAALIRQACGGRHDARWERCCGESPDDHDWTSKGEGGCRENPGVWSVGGTALRLASHCRDCGLRRREHLTGSQRNPHEHDTVQYLMPDSWCAECRREECACEPAEVDD